MNEESDEEGAERPVKSVIIANGTKEGILLRAKRHGETYPTHAPVRIMVDNVIHLVRGCDIFRTDLSLRFEPEGNWPKCPRCDKQDWSVWVAATQMIHQVCSNVERPNVYSRPGWYILCLHCDRIIVHHSVENPHSLKGVREYVYDPADDITKHFWPEIAPKRPRKRTH
ncbi:MAG: hypothetical protein QG626_86 [Patescibacteria group bacterium]|nr:hypothetical protein [Patescibacteria group bacterium]